MKDWLLDFIARLPSTNLRIAVTLLLCVATGVRVVVLGWDPAWEWLAALTAWLGLDVAQFTAKRATNNKGGNARLDATEGGAS